MGQGTILVVEDDPGINHLFTRVLVRAGYQVESVTNAHDAYNAMVAADFDVIVCDMRMPGEMSGFDLLRKYSQKMKDGLMPVIAVSANEEFRQPCEEIGVEFFLSKPVMPTELVTMVDRVVTMRRQSAAT